MSRIQELLAQQRKGKENAQPVLQSKTIEEKTETKTQVIAESLQQETVVPEQPKKPSLFERLGKKSASLPIPQTIPSVVDRPLEQEKLIIEEMPKGLSLLQQRAWKAKNEKISTQSSQSNDAGLGHIQSINSKFSENGNQTDNHTSASQTADAQKTNDGVANIGELKQNLAYLANNIENKEIVGQIVRTIALQLKNSPELTPGMTNADVNLVVRGARMAYQMAAMAKQNKEDNKKKGGKVAGEIDAMFKDAGLDFKINL